MVLNLQTITEPEISVVVLTYNSEQHLPACLDSLSGQSFKNFEVVVIDGGSRDGTERICRKFETVPLRFQVQTQRGHAAARNEGIRAAKAPWIAFLDSDDIAAPERLQRQLDHVKKYPETIAVGSWLALVDAEGKPRGVRRYVSEDAKIRAASACYNPFPNPAMLFRKDLSLQIGGFQRDICEDYDFYLRLMQKGRVFNIPEPLTRYRLHEGGSKAFQTRKQIEASLAIRREAKAGGLIRNSILGRCSDLAHRILLVLPPKFVYTLFEWMVRAKRI